MKFIKKILIIASALFIQFTSLTTAMDVSLHCKIFEQQDIMGCIVKHFGKETPFTDFWSYCSTNQKNYENYKDDANIFKLIALQSKYLNHDLQFLNPNNIASYRMLLACVEKDLPQLMGISRDMDIDYDNFMIKYETSLDMHGVFKMLVKIRTIEKKLTPDNCPLDPSSIFALDTRKTLWEADGAMMTYFRASKMWAEVEIRMAISNKIYKYVDIMFPPHDRGAYFNELYSLDVLEMYWFVMLTHVFFLKNPEIALLFSLSSGSNYNISLKLIDKDIIFKHEFKGLYERIILNPEFDGYIPYISEKHFVNKKIFKERKEYLKFALQEIPEAWNLYQKVLEYEFHPDEILGIEKPEVVAQLPH